MESDQTKQNWQGYAYIPCSIFFIFFPSSFVDNRSIPH